MAQKAGADMWKEIQDSSPAGWLILDEGDEVPEVTFLTGHHVIEPGDTELSGKVWDKDWTKNEIKVKKKNGERAILSIGGNKSPFLRTFIAKWQENGLTPDTLVGTKWYIKRTGKWDYDIRYLGREDEATASSSSSNTKDKEDKTYADIKTNIISLSSEPSVSDGLEEESFITAVAIKASVPKSKVSEYIDDLKNDGLIKFEDGKIKLI